MLSTRYITGENNQMTKDNKNNQLKKIIKSVNKAARGDYSVKLDKSLKDGDLEKLSSSINKLMSGFRKRLREQDGTKKIEKQLNRHNRALRVLSESNQKIIRAKSEKEILKKIPEILVNLGNYRFAWIGYANEDKEKKVVPLSYAGLSQKFVESLNISWADNNSGQGPTGTAIRKGHYVVCQNIHKDPRYKKWRDNALKGGYSSSIALPLKDSKKTFGTLNIYSSEADAFDNDEIKLLVELADDLSYGITALQTKEKHEEAKAALEESIAHNKFLADIIELSSQPFAIRLPEGRIGAFNKAFCELIGYSEQEVKKINWSKALTIDKWRDFETKKLSELNCNGEPVRYEKEYLHKNGTRIPVELLVHKVCDKNGELKYYYAFITDITDRKKIEESLKSTQFSVDKARDAIFWLQDDGKLVYVNESACKSLGYTKEELLSLHLFDIDPTFPRDKWKEHWAKTRELQSYLIESHHKTKDGRIFPVEVVINFMSFAGKEYHSAFVRDISERKKAEEQLKLTQFGIDNSQIGIYQIEDNGNIIYANNYACKSLGYSPDEILKLKLWDIDTSLEPDKWVEYRANTRFKEVFSLETFHKRKDGTEFPVEVYVNFIESENKKFSFTFARDITERKTFEEELKRSEEKFRNIFNNSPIGIYRTTRDGKIIDVNPAILTMLGYSSFEELAVKNLETDESFAKSTPRELFKDLLEKEGEIKGFETIWLRKDLSEVNVRENAKAIRDHNGKTLFYEGTVEDITEFKNAQKKLYESEKLFSTLAESGHYIIYLIDKNLKFKYVNKYASQYFGSNSRQMLNKRVEEFYSAISDSVAPASISMVFRKGESIYYESSLNINNQETWFGTRFIPLRNEKNEVDFVMSMTLDITDQKLNEERIRNEVNRTKALVKIASLLNATLNVEKLLDMICNETAQALNVPIVSILLFNKNNYNLEHVKSTGISADLEKYIPNISKTIIDKIIQDKGPIITFPDVLKVIKQNKKADTGLLNLRTLTFTRMLHNDELIGVLGILTINEERKFNKEELDLLQGIANQSALAIHNARLLSEHKKAEKALRESEFMLKESQKIAKLGQYTFEVKSGTWNSSEILNEIFGITENHKKDIDGWLEIIHPDDKQMMKTYLFNNILKEHLPFDKEYRIIRQNDGQERWVHGIGRLNVDENGNIIQMLGTIQDITERKIYESEIIAAKEKAEEMNRLKSNFLANMSHELRTPLFGIIGLSELLTHEITNPDQKEMIDAVHESSKRLSETLNLILDLSRIENKKVEIIPVEFDIVTTTLNIANTFKETANRKGIYLKTNFYFPAFRAKLDKRAYESILNNLINNAIKFTISGGVTVNISSELHEDKNYIVMKVADTGIGIAKEDFEIIFDEFRQASEGMSRSFEGSGLGLNITKKFIERLDGTISIESELGKGTEFTVKLPVIKTAELSGEKGQYQIEREKSLTLNYIPNILLVDDEVNVKPIIANYIGDIFKLSHVLNAEDAIELVKKEKFDAILMDINLQGNIDGIKATQKIRKIHGYEKTPIIACTAFALEGDKEEFLAAGCSHYISKPFNKTEIISLLGEIFK